jgi:hypothetical protein
MNVVLIHKQVLQLPRGISRADLYRVNTVSDGCFGLWRADHSTPTFIVCRMRERGR